MKPRALVSSRHDLAYVPIPKCATTSLKHAWYAIEHDGASYKPYQGGPDHCRHRHIHEYFRRDMEPLPPRRDQLFAFTVVRDPVSRFLSAYSNRVRHHYELSRARLDASPEPLARNLPSTPSLLTFVDLLEQYRAVSPPIRHHTAPMVSFIGTDLSRYSRVYDVSECDALAEVLSERTGQPVQIGRHQDGGPKLTEQELDAPRLRKIVAFYALDYIILNGRYRLPRRCGVE